MCLLDIFILALLEPCILFASYSRSNYLCVKIVVLRYLHLICRFTDLASLLGFPVSIVPISDCGVIPSLDTVAADISL